MSALGRVADHLVNLVTRQGVSKAFSVTGRGSLFLNDALARSEIETVFPLHEQSAGFAACGATSISGVPALCVVSTGSGATNMVTPLLTAFQDSIPVIVFSGQNHLAQSFRGKTRLGKTYGEQEVDIIEIVESLCNQALFMSDPISGLRDAERAISRHFEDLSGPLWIDVPLDIQSAITAFEQKGSKGSPTRNIIRPPAVGRAQSSRNLREGGVAEEDGTASSQVTLPEISALNLWNKGPYLRPVLIVGDRLPRICDASLLSEIVEIGLPIVTDVGGNGLIDSRESNYFGTIGAQGFERSAFEILSRADLILLIGVTPRSSLWGHSPESFFGEAFKCAVVPLNENDDHDRYSNEVQELPTYPNSILSSDWLLKLVRSIAKSSSWTDSDYREVRPEQTESIGSNSGDLSEVKQFDLREIARTFADSEIENAIVVVDSGFADVIFSGMARVKSGQTLLRPFAQGAMGYAIPAAIGACCVKDSPILVFVGEGSLMMNVQELATLRNLNRDVRIFVLNNGGYGIIKKRQKSQFRRRITGVDGPTGLALPKIADIAKGFAINYRFISSDIDFRRACSSVGLAIYELHTLDDQPYIQARRRPKTTKFCFDDLFEVE